MTTSPSTHSARATGTRRANVRTSKKKRRTQEERSATTRRKLIESAVTCISELGYLNSTVEVVANHAGVSRGAVQHHFGSRNDLLVAVVDEFGMALSTSDDIPANLTLAERVSAAIDLTWAVLKTPHFLAVVQIWLTMRHTRAIRPTIAKKIRLIEQMLDTEWQMLFREVAVPPATVVAIRHLVLATLRGLALRKLYFIGPSAWTDEITTLKQIVVSALSDSRANKVHGGHRGRLFNSGRV